MVIGVLVQLVNYNTDKVFDYCVPSCLCSKIKLGMRVLVPFGKQVLEGFIVEINKNSHTDNIKEIIQLVDEVPVLNEELLLLGQWLKAKTLAPLISCYQVMLPRGLKAKKGTSITKKYESYISLVNNVDYDALHLNLPQRKIVNCFKDQKLILKKKLQEISVSSVKTLLEKGLLQEVVKEKYRYQLHDVKPVKYSLTLQQQQVVDEVLNKLSTNKTFLLYGVTGSGKTECYMEMIDGVLKKGKTAIVLVPEISLTPQMIERFYRRFGNQIAVFHSKLSDGEKYDEWRRIAKGEAKMVIGARSAIFAPFTNLGIIIIDEEHSSTYKQEKMPRYYTIDVAKARAKYHNCPLILGSATPSLESYSRAISPKKIYELLSLPNRINQKKLPKVTVVNMHNKKQVNNFWLSVELCEAIKHTLARKEQVILLLNRRGYATFVTCQNCGYVEKCPNCDITLTYHKTSNILRCHYCGYATKKINVCPKCGENSIVELGNGTQKIEELLKQQFTEARILRMDYDTTSSKKNAHETMIKSFANNEYDILLGTQMIAKGLDFANVTLVGVINADISLNIPDFRSSEITFQLLSQVSGRSGRKDKEGQVIIQTFNPDHYVIKYVQNHDYEGFYKEEMKIRKQLKYPPFCYLTYVKISGKDYNVVFTEAKKIRDYLQKYLAKNIIILGPSVGNVLRIKNIYYFGIILKCRDKKNLNLVLGDLISHYQNNKQIHLDIDFNPNHI